MPLAIRVTADRAARPWVYALHAGCTNRTGRDNLGGAVAAARENAEGKVSPVSAEVAADCVPAFLARLWHIPCHLSTARAGNASVTEGLTAKNAEGAERKARGRRHAKALRRGAGVCGVRERQLPPCDAEAKLRQHLRTQPGASLPRTKAAAWLPHSISCKPSRPWRLGNATPATTPRCDHARLLTPHD